MERLKTETMTKDKRTVFEVKEFPDASIGLNGG